jgi:hypothetical protein
MKSGKFTFLMALGNTPLMQGEPIVRPIDELRLRRRIEVFSDLKSGVLKNGLFSNFRPGLLRAREVTENACELNRWMQHHLTEVSCFGGGVYEKRKTVWSFFGTEDRDLAPLEGGGVVA